MENDFETLYNLAQQELVNLQHQLRLQIAKIAELQAELDNTDEKKSSKKTNICHENFYHIILWDKPIMFIIF